jgi:hypothetical protein
VIAVVYGARTGSTFLAKKLAQEHEYEYLGEIFNRAEYTPHQSREIHAGLSSDNQSVIKVCASQMTQFPDINLINLLQQCERVIFTVRHDFAAQVRSTYVGRVLKAQGVGFADEFTDPITLPNNVGLHKRVVNDLIKRYQLNQKVFASLEHKEVCVYEDFATLGGRYRRPVIIEPELDTVDFDTTALYSTQARRHICE